MPNTRRVPTAAAPSAMVLEVRRNSRTPGAKREWFSGRARKAKTASAGRLMLTLLSACTSLAPSGHRRSTHSHDGALCGARGQEPVRGHRPCSSKGLAGRGKSRRVLRSWSVVLALSSLRPNLCRASNQKPTLYPRSAGIIALRAPVVQWIERRPPEPDRLSVVATRVGPRARRVEFYALSATDER